MPEAALTLLFALSGLFALGVVAQSWRRHGPQALATHDQWQACPETRIFTCRIVSHDVIRLPRAKVIAFPVRTGLNSAPQPLRAAA